MWPFFMGDIVPIQHQLNRVGGGGWGGGGERD